MRSNKTDVPLNGVMTGVLVFMLLVNQIVIGAAAEAMGMQSGVHMVMSVGTETAMAQTIVMPVLNEDGNTTSLREMPTITAMLGDPKSGDPVADAMAVMMGTGTTFYAPDGISFDDPLVALSTWGSYDTDIQLPADIQERFARIIMIFTCNFCCGSPQDVTVIGRCGCAHAQAARGFFKYMLSEYGDTYTDDQLVGEAYRWQAIWYPSGVVEDYLLSTGRGDVLGHAPHGGAGKDGMHGISTQ